MENKFKVFLKKYLIFGKYVVSSKNPVKGFSCGSLEKLCLHSQNSSIHQFGWIFSKLLNAQLFNPFMVELKAPYYHIIFMAKTSYGTNLLYEKPFTIHTILTQGVFFHANILSYISTSRIFSQLILIRCESHSLQTFIH